MYLVPNAPTHSHRIPPLFIVERCLDLTPLSVNYFTQSINSPPTVLSHTKLREKRKTKAKPIKASWRESLPHLIYSYIQICIVISAFMKPYVQPRDVFISVNTSPSELKFSGQWNRKFAKSKVRPQSLLKWESFGPNWTCKAYVDRSYTVAAYTVVMSLTAGCLVELKTLKCLVAFVWCVNVISTETGN